MINPGYISRTQKNPIKDVGQVIRCPLCKKILGEGEVIVLHTRCKHCGFGSCCRKKRKMSAPDQNQYALDTISFFRDNIFPVNKRGLPA